MSTKNLVRIFVIATPVCFVGCHDSGRGPVANKMEFLGKIEQLPGGGVLVCPEPQDRVPSFDKYLTWRDASQGYAEYPFASLDYFPNMSDDYSGPLRPGQPRDSCSDVVFYWMDEPVGKGDVGFGVVLGRMNQLPPGARVLLFPDYQFCTHGGGIVYDLEMPPWCRGGNRERIMEVVERRGLTLIVSPNAPK